MKELFTTYTVDQIVMFIILLACAIKGAVGFYDWAKERLGKIIETKTKKNKEQQDIEIRFDVENNQIQEVIEHQKVTDAKLDKITDSIQLLIQSDKDDIKSWITEKHHYFCNLGYIDSYSLDTIEKRYSHYQQEGGNSFVESLMNEIRSLKIKD